MDSGSARTHIRLPTIPEIDHHPSSLIKIDTQRPRKAKTKTPKSAPFCVGAMADDAAEKETFDFQMSLLSTTVSNVDDSVRGTHEELQTTPLFSSAVQATVGSDPSNLPDRLLLDLMFPQYGLLAADVEVYDKFIEISGTGQKGSKLGLDDGRIFLNVNTPWSAFICGSQGSGKSHTLSCMLEDCLLPSEVGKLPSPLAGIVFHYDQFTSDSGGQICEAAYLCSSGIPVRVLVSPTNFFHMKQAYENLPGLSAGTKKPEVFPMLLREKQLDIQKMMNLMAVSEKDGPLPLYMEVVCKILRRMAQESQGAPGFDYAAFKNRLLEEGFTDKQSGPLRLRLDLLESFMEMPPERGGHAFDPKPGFPSTKGGRKSEKNWEQAQTKKAEQTYAKYCDKPDIWDFKAGSLTIVDLSCPFVDDGAACVLFNICLALFLKDRSGVGRVVALDEAHKVLVYVSFTSGEADAMVIQFMTGSAAATTFTESLLSVIRQQRHLASRVIIATQEPTLSPKLLDLTSVTIVHRFTSPEWLNTLKFHLAGASAVHPGSARILEEIFDTVVNLKPGEALLFSPSAMLRVTKEVIRKGITTEKVKKLGMHYMKIRVRKRLTADGGRSIMAT